MTGNGQPTIPDTNRRLSTLRNTPFPPRSDALLPVNHKQSGSPTVRWRLTKSGPVDQLGCGPYSYAVADTSPRSPAAPHWPDHPLVDRRLPIPRPGDRSWMSRITVVNSFSATCAASPGDPVTRNKPDVDTFLSGRLVGDRSGRTARRCSDACGSTKVNRGSWLRSRASLDLSRP